MGWNLVADPKSRLWDGTGNGFLIPRSHHQYQPYNTAAPPSSHGVGGSQAHTASHVVRGGSSSVTAETTKSPPPFIDFLGVGAT